MDLFESVEVPMRVIVGLIPAAFTFWFYQQYVNNYREWRRIFDPAQPSLQGGASPFDRVFLGSVGCMSAVIWFVAFVLGVAISVDVMLFGGQGLIQFMVEFLPRWSAAIWSFVESRFQ